MVKLTLKQCAYLIAVADQGGIAQAARSLHISQPAVAQAVDKLEQTWSLQLFVRHHARGVELTPQGRTFVRSARKLLRQAEQTERDARSIAAGHAGIIRFGCFHTIAPQYLAGIIRDYREAYPDVEIEARELLQDEIISAIETGRIDLAMTYDMSLDGLPFERRVLTRLKPYVLLNAQHPLARRRSLALADLASEPFVMFDGPSSREYFSSLLSGAGIDPPIAYHSKTMESVHSAVANGLGFSLSVIPLPRDASDKTVRIVPMPMVDGVDPLAIVLLHKRQLPESALLQDFADFCARCLMSATD